MNNNTELIIGGVYQTGLTSKPVRIIAFNRFQVFYEVWWEHANDWGCKSNLKGRVNYYCTYTKNFLGSNYLRIEPFTEEELKIHRPDLPFYLCRIERLNWNTENFANVKDFEGYILSKGIETSKLENLDIPEIILMPYGKDGFAKKGAMVSAANSKSFIGAELLWQAQNMQAPHLKTKTGNGMGIYRMGFEKGIPSYYIGGYYDNAEALKQSL